MNIYTNIIYFMYHVCLCTSFFLLHSFRDSIIIFINPYILSIIRLFFFPLTIIFSYIYHYLSFRLGILTSNICMLIFNIILIAFTKVFLLNSIILDNSNNILLFFFSNPILMIVLSFLEIWGPFYISLQFWQSVQLFIKNGKNKEETISNLTFGTPVGMFLSGFLLIFFSKYTLEITIMLSILSIIFISTIKIAGEVLENNKNTQEYKSLFNLNYINKNFISFFTIVLLFHFITNLSDFFYKKLLGNTISQKDAPGIFGKANIFTAVFFPLLLKLVLLFNKNSNSISALLIFVTVINSLYLVKTSNIYFAFISVILNKFIKDQLFVLFEEGQFSRMNNLFSMNNRPFINLLAPKIGKGVSSLYCIYLSEFSILNSSSIIIAGLVWIIAFLILISDNDIKDVKFQDEKPSRNKNRFLPS